MNFYKPNFALEPDSPFARDKNNKLVRRSYWYDLQDISIVNLLKEGIGSHLSNEEKRNHLIDIKKEDLIEKVCVQEIIDSKN